MSWNYRIVRTGDGAMLCEVHYDASGAPVCFTASPATFDVFDEQGGKPEDIVGMLRRGLEGAEKPMLSAADFGGST